MRGSICKLFLASVLAWNFLGCSSKGGGSTTESSISDLSCSTSAAVQDSRCQLQSLKWQTVAASPIHMPPEGYLSSPTGVFWTGQKILAWGNVFIDSSSPYPPVVQEVTSTGEIYDPATNTWSSMSTTNSPAARADFISAFTGDKMIVWGGRSASADFIFGDGGIYNVSTNSWNSISIVNAPTTRFAALSVWTGSTVNTSIQNKLIVFGGQQDFTSSTLNDGGIYDQASDSWTTISNIGAPSPRRYATAVWTGSKMIVWGGENLQAYPTPVALGDGAIFDPATNTWSSISSSGAPSSRALHAAVWTGSKMIVWGGGDPWAFGIGSYLNDGAAYDPSTDTWTPISNLNAPAARSYQGYTWSGSKLYIYGGRNYTTTANDGGIYDPTTDTWESIASANSAVSRTMPTLLWTGSSMYVYGGTTSTGAAAPTQVYGLNTKLVSTSTSPTLLPEPLAPVSPWIKGLISPSSQWSAIAYGNGIFVGISFNTNVAASSIDGVTWTQRALPATAGWIAITYGNGRFIAVAANSSIIATSSDGINWTSSTLPSVKNWSSIAYGNGRFIAVALGYGAVSSDGVTWSIHNFPNGEWNKISFGNGRFIATGGSAIGVSSDGSSWTIAAIPNLTNVNWVSATYGNGVYVAIASGNNSNLIATSIDGDAWTPGRLPSLQNWNNVTFGNGIFVATAFVSNIVAISNDGITWVQQSLPISNSVMTAYGNGRFIVLGASGSDGDGNTAFADLH